MTAISKWIDCSHLVETVMRVEQSLAEEKQEVEPSQVVSSASRFLGQVQTQRRFTLRVSGRDFKSQSNRQPF